MLSPKFLAASIVAFGMTGDRAAADASQRAAGRTPFPQFDDARSVTSAEAMQIAGAVERFAKFAASESGTLVRSELAALVATLR